MLSSQETFIKLKITEQELQNTMQELESLKYAIDQASIVSIIDHKGIIIDVNSNFCQHSKYTKEELIGKGYQSLFPDFQYTQYFQSIWQMVSSGKTWRGELCYQAKDGSLYWLEGVVVPFFDSNRRPYQYIVIQNDITQQKMAEQKIMELIQYDELTGSLHRKHFIQMLDEQMKKREPISLFLVNIDRFTIINDTFGHEIGDRILLEMANRLKQMSLNNISRLSVDEFAFFIPNFHKKELEEFNHFLIRSLQMPFHVEGYELNIAFRVGVSHFPEEGTDSLMLINNCRMAMRHYQQMVDEPIYNYSNDLSYVRAIQLASELTAAIKNDQLQVIYQPRVDIETGEITSAEAFVFWDHPEFGLIDPSNFISMAAEVGIVVPIDEWVLQKVCAQNKLWQKKGFKPIVIAINFPARTIAHHNFSKKIQSILNVTKLNPQWIQIETSENMTLRGNPYIYKSFMNLKKFGVSIGLNDFGTGYTSFLDLQAIDLDYIKINEQFIKNIHLDSANEEVVRAILSICKATNKKVVIDGVGKKEELAVLKKMQLPMEIQGVIYSLPVSADDFELLLMKGTMKNVYTSDVPIENRRRYYRIELLYPMIATIRERQQSERKEWEVIIENIGPGGVKILTTKQLMGFDTTIDIAMTILNKVVTVRGKVVYGKMLLHRIYAYGIEFMLNDAEREKMISLLNQFAVQVKRMKMVPNSNMIKEDRIKYLLEKSV